MQRGLRKALGLVERIEDWILIGMLTALVLIAVAQIIYRNLMGEGILWADPVLRILVLWVALSGAVIATRTDKHIRIDFFTRFIPSRYQLNLHRVVFMISAGVCGFIAWHSFRFIAEEYTYGSIAFLEVPTWAAASIIPIAFSLMTFRYLLLLFGQVQVDGEQGAS